MDTLGAARFSATVPIFVAEHAYWRAAERFPGFDTIRIEDEVRAAIAAGRVTADRRTLGLAAGSDPSCVYVWEPTGERIYALRLDRFDGGRTWAVTTTMRRKHG